jgi:hypothetical protein
MTNYTNGKIYKICGGDEVYIGSTCKPLSRRFTCHKSKYNNKCSTSTSRYLFETYGVENCTIELIENFPCDSKKDLFEREGYYIRTIKCVNKLINGREPKESAKETYEKYKEKRKEDMKLYYQKNKEKVNENNKQSRLKRLANRAAAAAEQIVEPI